MNTLITVLGCGSFWVFTQWILDKIFKKRGETLEQIQKDIAEIKQENKNNNELTLAISRDRLNHLCNRYLEAGAIPLQEYDAFISIGEAYINSGGNSVIKDKFLKCRELPIK